MSNIKKMFFMNGLNILKIYIKDINLNVVIKKSIEINIA